MKEYSNWLDLIDILQNDLKLDVYPGGYSAMIGWYHQHEGRFKYIFEYIYGTETNKIPRVLLEQEKWGRKFYLIDSSYFPKDIGMNIINTFGYKIKIASKERALLEMTARVGQYSDIERVFEYYTDLADNLDSKNYQELLEKCTSESLRRLGLFLAEESESLYYPKLELDKIPLSLDKNRDYSFNEYGSNHVPKYNIQVPANLILDICEYIPAYARELYSEGAV